MLEGLLEVSIVLLQDGTLGGEPQILLPGPLSSLLRNKLDKNRFHYLFKIFQRIMRKSEKKLDYYYEETLRFERR